MKFDFYWTLSDWSQAYASGQDPKNLLLDWLFYQNKDDPAWIELITEEQLVDQIAYLEKLKLTNNFIIDLPLYGIPVAVKDNIDVIGFKTTAACPEFSYSPNRDAGAVELLRSAGAIIVGKTNLDQFATGLVGTRSPYGEVPNSFNPEFISGGSSSGSASLVSRGIVPIALGTDTAGSGRVPAGLNNIIGLKATCGAVSTRGVVPACRTLDCVSIFALTLADASKVFNILNCVDENDPWSRSAPQVTKSTSIKRLGIPSDPPWFNDSLHEEAWKEALFEWKKLDIELFEIDFTLLWELAALLYDGPWVAERYATVADFVKNNAYKMNPVVRGIIEKANDYSALSVFQAEYKRKNLVNNINSLLKGVDALLVPTTPFFPSREDVSIEPILVNSRLGTYTNFVNLSDKCALSIPAGFRSDGLPFGVTLIADAWQDTAILKVASRWLKMQTQYLGNSQIKCLYSANEIEEIIDSTHVDLAVVGAHLTGMPLNYQLIDRDAVLIKKTFTSQDYLLYALANSIPPKPGLIRTAEGKGACIEVEIWRIPSIHIGSFLSLIPPPLGLGTVTLKDGNKVKGFICEGIGLEGAINISEFGGWRNYCLSEIHPD